MKVQAALLALFLAAAPLFATPPDEGQFRTWVSQLGDDDVKVRDAAQRELEKLESNWKPALKQAITASTDPEARLRLKEVLARLSQPMWHTDLSAAMAEARHDNKPLLVLATPGAPDGFS